MSDQNIEILSSPKPAANQDQDLFFMSKAFLQAKKAAALKEIPVGAVIARGESIVSAAFNQRESTQDPLAHAETEALRRAARRLERRRLSDCSLYVTLEPCLMCCGAVLQARIRRLVYACRDLKGGGIQELIRQPHLPAPSVTGGVMEEECARLLKAFFQNLRASNSETAESGRDGA